MSADGIFAHFKRPLVTGLLLLDNRDTTPLTQEPFQTLMAIAHDALRSRQLRNGDESLPLSYDPAAIIQRIIGQFELAARTRLRAAQSLERSIVIKYAGWLPTPTPVEQFETKWIASGPLPQVSSNVCRIISGPTDHVLISAPK